MAFDITAFGLSSQAAQWLVSHGIRVAAILLSAAILVAMARGFIARKSIGLPGIGEKFKKHYEARLSAEQRQRLQTIANALGGTLAFAIYATAIVMVLPEFGVNVAPIIAGLGLAGLAIGMAARDILTDFIAGLFILIEEQFNIGDPVTVSGISGTVREITLRRTVIESEDGSIHLIPNREIKVVTRRSNRQ